MKIFNQSPLVQVFVIVITLFISHSCSTDDVELIDGSVGEDMVRIPDVAFGEYLFYNQTRGVYHVREDGESAFYLNPSEVTSVTTINVSKTANSTQTLVNAGLATAEIKITDLTGIEYFTGLTRLVFTSNTVTSLDVSRLTELEALEMNFNLIGSLDLTQNPKLTTLRFRASASGNEQQRLSTLDLSNNRALTHLFLPDHNFVTIDLTNNTNIREMLDFSGNPGPDGNRSTGDIVVPATIYDQLAPANRLGVVSDADQPLPDETVVIDGFEYVPVTANITASQNWTKNNDYLLRGKIMVTDGATLTVQAGTRIFAEITDVALVIAAGGKIVAQGTSAEPIRFTSLAARSTSGEAGQWGGVFIHGRAPVSSVVAVQEEYGGTYGGSNAGDDSGTLEYVEISFAGSNVVSNNDNAGGLQLNGVGSGTRLQHLYVNHAHRYGIQARGGTANLKYIFINTPNGRAFTWNNGYIGYVQHLVAVYHSNPGSAVTAIEGFADAGNTTGPILSNISVNGKGGGNTRGIWLRDNARAAVHNSWFTQTAAGLRVLNSLTAPDPVIANNIFWGNTNDYATNADSNSTNSRYSGSNSTSASITLDGDFRGITATGALNPTTLNAWFSPSSYIGAVDPANDWTGWWN